MTKEQYILIMDSIRSVKYGERIIYITGKALTYLTAVIYIFVIMRLSLLKDMKVVRIIAVPAAGFALVTAFRAKYNAQRPYEKYGFKPLIPKDTHGKSFPSRHVFSIFMCAGAVSFIYPVLGVVMCAMGFLLAIIRVVSGVHFPKDVAAGAFAGILCSIVGFSDL